MTSKEWKNYTDKEKQLYKKGYYLAVDELVISSTERETKKEEFNKYLKALEEV